MINTIITYVLILAFGFAIVIIPIAAIKNEIEYRKLCKHINELLDEIEKKINNADCKVDDI